MPRTTKDSRSKTARAGDGNEERDGTRYKSKGAKTTAKSREFVKWRTDCPWIIQGLPFTCKATGLKCRREFCAPIFLIERKPK